MPRPLHGPIYTGPDYEPLPSGDLRDHAEERAQASEQQRENAAEAAFEAGQIRAVRALEALAASSQEKARRFARTLNNQLDAMALPSAHHLLMMKRAATVAHMAKRAALSLGSSQSYDLRPQLDRLLDAISASEPNGATEFAAGRVRICFAQAIADEQEAAFAAASGHED